MIRINLLSERRTVVAVSKGFQAGQEIPVVGSLLVVLTLVGVGWRHWAIGQQEAHVVRDVEAAKREEQRLVEILKQLQEFEARKAQLERRVALIDELRKGQGAPVHMIDQVSRALPDMTWLTSVRQEGYNLTIQGRCLTLTLLSDFVGNLEASRYFQRPVEIVDSVVVNGPGTTTDLIQFTIRGAFQMAGIDPPAPGAAATKGKGGKRG